MQIKKLFFTSLLAATMLLSACGNEPGSGGGQVNPPVEGEIHITSEGNKNEVEVDQLLQLHSDVAGVTWSSSNGRLAYVDEDGLVDALNPGNVTIYAKKQGYKDGSFALTIVEPQVVEVTGVKLNVAKTTLYFGEDTETTFTVTVTPNNATNPECIITSSNDKIVKVQDNKLVVVDEGKAVITAVSASKQTIKDSVTVEVIDRDDLWNEDTPSGDTDVDKDLPAKEGEKYDSYKYDPIVEGYVPKMTVTLTTQDDGQVPALNNTYIVNASKNNKGDYYKCTVGLTNPETNEEVLPAKACQIKVRGNYTVNYRKKPLRLKFDKKLAMPGFSGQFKNWVLLADVKDHSMMRNAISFYLGQRILGSDGLYSSNFRPVELYFIDNSGVEQYWGSYLLCEQQEIKAGRVDITDVGDIKGTDGVKGNYNGTDIGYFFEFDGYYSEEGPTGDPTFTVNYNNHASYRTINGNSVTPNQVGYTMKGDLSGDDNSAQKAFISSYVENVYRIMYNATFNNTFYKFNDTYTALVIDPTLTCEQAIRNVIDVNSLADTYIISELSCDPDVNWSSFYLDVDFGATAKDHLLRFEAPWDFDSCYAVRSGNYCISGEGYYAAASANPWLSLLNNNEWFMDIVKTKYNELYGYDILKDTLDFILDRAADADYVAMYKRNFDKWGTNDETHEVRSELAALQTQAEHARALHDWLYTRMNWLSKTWLKGYDVKTHQKVASYQSHGNTALLTNARAQRFEAELSNYGNCAVRGASVGGNGYGASNEGYLGQVNNGSIIFNVHANKHKQAYLRVCVAQQSSNIQFGSLFTIKVNGQALKISNDVILPGKPNMSWHDWYAVDINSFWLNEGNNVIEFVIVSGTNFDYIDIFSKDTLTWAGAR